MVPAPAMRGKASGTMDTVSGISSLKNFTPSTISIAIIKITSEPAIANEDTSSPIISNSPFPANKNKIINTNTAILAFSDSI